MTPLPGRLHVLRAINKPGLLSTIHNEKPYVFAFVSDRQIIHTCRHLSDAPELHIPLYRPLPSKVVHEENEISVTLEFDYPSLVQITKTHTPDWHFYTDTVVTEQMLDLPAKHNIGLVILYKLVTDAYDVMTFESFIVDPIADPELFRFSLSSLV